ARGDSRRPTVLVGVRGRRLWGRRWPARSARAASTTAAAAPARTRRDLWTWGPSFRRRWPCWPAFVRPRAHHRRHGVARAAAAPPRAATHCAVRALPRISPADNVGAQ